MNANYPEFPLFCGKKVSQKEQQLILEIVDRFKRLARTELASTLCELLAWVRPNGKLKTVECRQFLELLQHQKRVALPDKRVRSKPVRATIAFTKASQAKAPLQGPLKDLRPVSLDIVQTDKDRALWKELIERYHYLGYRIPFGAHLRYLIHARPDTETKTLLGCLQFSSPAWRMAARDQWIGWSDSLRASNLQSIINNSRFLILPHVQVHNLASHVLSLAARQIVRDWQAQYHIKPLLIETLVDINLFSGHCYRAANWQEVGVTTGRGRQDRQHQRHDVAPKRVFLYPLHKQAREQLLEQRRG